MTSLKYFWVRLSPVSSDSDFLVHYRFMGHSTDIDGALKTCDRENPVILVAHQPATAKKALEMDYRLDLILSGLPCKHLLNYLSFPWYMYGKKNTTTIPVTGFIVKTFSI